MQRLLGFFCFLWAFGASAEQREPIGENAFYNLDKRNGRTSSMIKSGNFVAEVSGVSANAAIPSFDVAINYEFDVAWVGNQTGTETMAIDQHYFTQEFLDELRVNGTYQTSEFKVKHMGFADAVNMDGQRYEHCDKLYFYEIKTDGESALSKLIVSTAYAMLIGGGNVDANQIENLAILAHVKYGNPVIGAVKIDVSGKYNGMNVKAGGDYIPR